MRCGCHGVFLDIDQSGQLRFEGNPPIAKGLSDTIHLHFLAHLELDSLDTSSPGGILII
jgi:hypothetical protein